MVETSKDREIENVVELIAKKGSEESISSILTELLSLLPFGVVLLDGQYRIRYFNSVINKLVGDSFLQVMQPIHDLCLTKSESDRLQEVVKAGSTQFYEFSFRGKLSSHIPVKLQAVPIHSYTVLFIEDLSEIRTMEDELRNFEIAIESADDAILLFDESGLIFYANSAFERQVGIALEDVLGRNLQDFWSDHVPSVVYTDLWGHVRGGKTWAGELICIWRDQLSFDVEVHVTPIHNNEKEIVGYICIQRDISHRKELEQQLAGYSDNLERRVEERTITLSKLQVISHLFHTTNTMDKLLRLILIASTAGEAFRFNRAYLLLVDEEERELRGSLAVGPSDPAEAGHIWDSVERLPRKKDLLETLKILLENPMTEDQHVNWIAQQMSTSMENSHSILVQTIRKRKSIIVHKGEADVDFDPSILQLLECTDFAVIPLLVLDKPLGVLVVDNAITRHEITEDNVRMLEILATQGALAIAHARALEMLAQKVKETERAYSELRHSQEQLVEAGKFAALGQMAATVAHEIRTPLVAIGGFANMLLKKQNPEGKDYHYLNIIREEALRLEDVLNRLLFYARPSVPFMELDDFNKYIESILSFMNAEITFHEIQVHCDFEPHLEKFYFDRNLIRQVVVNLVQNAIQAMKNGGILSISTRLSENWVELTIQDTGEGIAKEQLDRIFEPFYSTKHTGTGLGLHVSQRIIYSHGGNIDIKSELDKGTEVSVRLPYRKELPDEKNTGHR